MRQAYATGRINQVAISCESSDEILLPKSPHNQHFSTITAEKSGVFYSNQRAFNQEAQRSLTHWMDCEMRYFTTSCEIRQTLSSHIFHQSQRIEEVLMLSVNGRQTAPFIRKHIRINSHLKCSTRKLNWSQKCFACSSISFVISRQVELTCRSTSTQLPSLIQLLLVCSFFLFAEDSRTTNSIAALHSANRAMLVFRLWPISFQTHPHVAETTCWKRLDHYVASTLALLSYYNFKLYQRDYPHISKCHLK